MLGVKIDLNFVVFENGVDGGNPINDDLVVGRVAGGDDDVDDEAGRFRQENEEDFERF